MKDKVKKINIEPHTITAELESDNKMILHFEAANKTVNVIVSFSWVSYIVGRLVDVIQLHNKRSDTVVVEIDKEMERIHTERS